MAAVRSGHADCLQRRRRRRRPNAIYVTSTTKNGFPKPSIHRSCSLASFRISRAAPATSSYHSQTAQCAHMLCSTQPQFSTRKTGQRTVEHMGVHRILQWGINLAIFQKGAEPGGPGNGSPQWGPRDTTGKLKPKM